jgi:hypothetical protein
MVDLAAEGAKSWWWVTPAVSLLGGLVGGWLGSYFAKKQRYWDLKRDTALDVMRVFGELQQILNRLFQLLQAPKLAKEEKNIKLMTDAMEDQDRALEQYLATIGKFWQAQATVVLVFPESIARQMGMVQIALSHLVELLKEKQEDAAAESEQKIRMDRFYAEKKVLTEAIKKELRL